MKDGLYQSWEAEEAKADKCLDEHGCNCINQQLYSLLPVPSYAIMCIEDCNGE